MPGQAARAITKVSPCAYAAASPRYWPQTATRRALFDDVGELYGLAASHLFLILVQDGSPKGRERVRVR